MNLKLFPENTLEHYEFMEAQRLYQSVDQRSITSSILPALGSETAGQTARKYAPEYEQLARFAAALAHQPLPPLPRSQLVK